MDTANGTRKAGGATANNLKQLKMIAAVDMFVTAVRVMNPVAQLSDIILPLTEDYEDPTNRFKAIEKGFVYQYPVVGPQGEARSREWINIQIANALNPAWGQAFSPMLYNVPWDDWVTTYDTLAQTAYNTWAASATGKAQYGGTPPTWAQFLQHPVIRLPQYITNPPNDTAIAFVPQIQNIAHNPFNTKSGLMEFNNALFTETNFTSASIVANSSSSVNLMSVPIAPLAIVEPIVGGYFDPNSTQYPFVCMSTMPRHKEGAMHENNPMNAGEISHNPRRAWISASMHTLKES